MGPCSVSMCYLFTRAVRFERTFRAWIDIAFSTWFSVNLNP